MWKVTQLMNQVAGGLPKTSASFSTTGGTLLIFASGSGWRNVAGAIGMDIQVDGVTKGSATVTASEANSHKAFIPNTIVVTGIAAGSHTVTLSAWGNTTTDSNDWYSVVVTELPF
jgi:hypothetical protein